MTWGADLVVSDSDHAHLALATPAVRTHTVCLQSYVVNSLDSIYKAGLTLSLSVTFQRLIRKIPTEPTTSTVKVPDNPL